MENTFVIAWRSKSEPRWGQGKKLLAREEAVALAEELNQDYPAFTHEAFDLAAPETMSAATEALESSIIAIDFEPAAAVPTESAAAFDPQVEEREAVLI